MVDAPSRAHRLVVVDDHPVVLDGVRCLIDSQADLRLVGSASSVEEALPVIESAAPDLVIVDLTLGDTSGLELIRQLGQRRPPVPTLVLSMHEDAVSAQQVFQAGARGYISKQEASSVLIEGIRRILGGEVYLSSRIARQVVAGPPPALAAVGPPGIAALTPRELEVFELVGKGLSNREIALLLHLGPRTVSTHRDNIKRKLQLRRSSEVVAQAARWIEKRTR